MLHGGNEPDIVGRDQRAHPVRWHYRHGGGQILAVDRIEVSLRIVEQHAAEDAGLPANMLPEGKEERPHAGLQEGCVHDLVSGDAHLADPGAECEPAGFARLKSAIGRPAAVMRAVNEA